jgi:hypothetical protein
MRGPMKLMDDHTGLMNCRVCGSEHIASLQSGNVRTDGITRYYRGSYQCSYEGCPSNEKQWDDQMHRYVKPDWRSLANQQVS